MICSRLVLQYGAQSCMTSGASHFTDGKAVSLSYPRTSLPKVIACSDTPQFLKLVVCRGVDFVSLTIHLHLCGLCQNLNA